MTKEEAVAKFRQMWRRMGALKINKFEYIQLFSEDEVGSMIGYCHLCAYIQKFEKVCCLIKWEDDKQVYCLSDGSLLRRWEEAVIINNRKEMGKLALLISELPACE